MENYEGKNEGRKAKYEETGYTNVKLKDGQLAEFSPMLLHVFHQIFYAERHGSAHLNELDDQVPIEASLVALADTITDPRTVMVVRCHALIA